MILKIFFLLSLCLGESAFACRLSYPDNNKYSQFTMLSSPLEGRTRSYSEGYARSLNNQYVTINNCPEGSVVAISRGLEVPTFEFPTRDAIYQNKLYHNQSCEIANYPLSGSAAIDRTIDLDKKFKVVDDCIRYKISGEEDVIANLQSQLTTQLDREGKIACEFRALSKTSMMILPKNIGTCMFPMGKKPVEVTFDLDPACSKLEYFSQNQIKLQELRASIRFDKLDAMDGNSGKSSLGTIQGVMQFNANLPNNQTIANIPMTSVGRRKQLDPSYLAVWPLEIALAKLVLHNLEYEENGVKKTEALIQSSFLVDNRCESFCKDGLCTSPCSYSHPAYAAASFYKIGANKSRSKLAKSWYTGGSAMPDWVGTITGSYYRLNKNLEVGQTYEAEFNFTDPRRTALRYLDFMVGNSDYYLEPTEALFNGDINDLADLPEFSGVEELESIAELDEDLDKLIGDDLSVSAKRFWPPKYKHRWLGERSSESTTINSGVGRSNVTVKVRFKVKGIEGNQYVLEDVQQSLTSTLPLAETCQKLGSVQTVNSGSTGKPLYSCQANFIEVKERCN
jgi:hypothetical protein